MVWRKRPGRRILPTDDSTQVWHWTGG